MKQTFTKFTMLLIAITLSTSLMAANQVVTLSTDANSGGGGNAGDLRYAIENVGNGETITFNIVGNDVITITSELGITESMTINGYNAATGNNVTVQVTAPGTSTWRVFNINASGETVTIENMTIKGGDISGFEQQTAGYGGGIFVRGDLSLDDVTVSGSKAYLGGGIYEYAGTTTITNSTITSNTANNGGGIFISSNAAVIISGSTISSNSANHSMGKGGGILAVGGTFSITSSTVSGNTANRTGGGIRIDGSAVTIVNSTIANNHSDNNNSGTAGLKDGGGIYLAGGTLDIRNTIIANNYEGSGTTTGNDYYYAAGTLTDNGFNVVENQAGASNQFGSTNNLLNTDPTGLASSLTYEGGFTEVLKVSAGNIASGNIGSTTEITDQRGYYRTSSAITRGAYQYNGIVAKNGSGTSWTGSSDVYSTIQSAVDAAFSGNTVVLAETAILIENDGTDIEVDIAESLTIEGAGATSTTVRVATPGVTASRVFNIDATGKTINISNITMKGGDISGEGTNLNGYGGGISVAAGTLNLNGVIVSGSIAYTGGGIYNDEGATISSISACTISGNEANGEYGGGGIYNGGTITAILNSAISENTIHNDESGGGICNIALITTIANSTISGNTASFGGGIFSAGLITTISNSTISGNTATGDESGGGGIVNFSGGEITTLTNTTICGNTASGEEGLGAGLVNAYATISSIRNCIIANNTDSDTKYDYFGVTEILTTDGGYNVVEYSNVAANADNGFDAATNILYNTKNGDGTTTNTTWTKGGSDLSNQNLNLSSTLADNGGPTQTLAIESGSFAISAGSWDASITTDQRGESRHEFTPTIGAYEPRYSGYWTGTTNSDWNTTTNWDDGDIAASGDDVIIPNVTNDPVIAYNGTASCNNLTIDADASLTIKSTVDGTGSLFTNGTITNNGTVNVERYVSESVWHLISVPNNVTTANSFLGDYLQTWDETTHSWTDISEPITALIPVKGYGFWGTPGKATTYTYTGTPNTGNQTHGITFTEYSTEPDAFEGANLLGNPYPSAIDWDGLCTTYGSVYYWSGTAYVSWNDDGDGSRYIPPMQGFFIVTDADMITATGGTFDVGNSNRTHNDAAYYKSGKQIKSNSIVLETKSLNYSDKVFIRLDAATSEGFDLQYDAWKLLSNTKGLSQLYSFTGEKKLSIDVRPDTEVIQLGFKNDENGIYSIGIKEIADIPEAFIEDTKTGLFHNLHPDSYRGGDYEFAWNPDIDNENRFKLHLNVVGIEEAQISESNILIYASNKQIHIKGAEKGQVIVSDMMGRVVLEESISGSELTTIPANLETGVYVVSVHSGTEIKTEKVFIK